MALSGSVKTNSYDGRYYQVSWTATQDVANNKSTISWTLKAAGGNSSWYAERTVNVKVAGSSVYSKTSRVERYAGNITSGSVTVSHGSDGTKSFSISLEVACYYSSINLTGSGSFTLNTIPRASSISMGTGTMNSASTITISRASSSFTHTLQYYFGTASGTIVTKTSSTSVSWTPPLSLANQVPNATSGTGTLRCITYSGSTKIGQKDISITLKVPTSVIPTISAASVTIDNSANSVVAGWGLYVAGYSKAKITATAAGAYGSTISSFTISGGYSTTQSGTSLAYTGSTFSSSGSKTFNVVAKDSRGRSSSSKAAGTITVYAYSKPTLSLFTVARSTSNSKQMIVKANWSFASVNSKNSATATLYYKKSTASAWTTYGTISKNTSVTLTTEFEEASSYNFRIIVRDALSNSAQAETFVSTVEVLLDFRAGGKGLGVGKIAETDSMEVAMDIRLMKGVYIYVDGTPVTLENYIKSVMSG